MKGEKSNELLSTVNESTSWFLGGFFSKAPLSLVVKHKQWLDLCNVWLLSVQKKRGLWLQTKGKCLFESKICNCEFERFSDRQLLTGWISDKFHDEFHRQLLVSHGLFEHLSVEELMESCTGHLSLRATYSSSLMSSFISPCKHQSYKIFSFFNCLIFRGQARGAEGTSGSRNLL